ncbi:hypothetical protein SGQ83_00540 [Flavobacterium sp. Fl-318]|uniref:NERD domain-containing protein n=1 Tax=Flavobacterium cupriresistens TaxID=2893885 RepID=A0ABU4R876_9FLAO|nr:MULTISPECIES: hypothetical protein [unclassified Flavobacterium]MDX6187824.1 hypothetical protein [Flavobacterium sp. Fl-318]UFH42254.1 hypothetical protein LNP23_20910 [Flavobacterium sp. F-323]
MKENLVEIEKQIDTLLEELSIWKLSFQDIYSTLLLMTEKIDYNGDKDTAMDYLSRISLIYPTIKKLAQDIEIESTTTSILKTGNKKFLDDINFLIAYAHFSLLMPQIHRNVLSVNQVSEFCFELDFANENIKNSELIDKLYSTISLQISFSSKELDNIKLHTDKKAKEREYNFNGSDFQLINKLFEHHKKFFMNIQVLPDEIIESKLGFNHSDFILFSSALKAYSDYFIILARSYKEQINEEQYSPEENDKLMSEYMEWSVCCLKYQALGWFLGTSGLNKDKFDVILSYFIDIYSNETGIQLIENSSCGEGYLPPITLIEKSIIFSPHALRYLVNFNNILYSINQKNKKLFNDEISQHLEPTLINQLEYLFSEFNDLEIRKNVTYTKSEIDMLLLSKKENICITIQVKTTIAPDSTRSVARVQDRTLEAFKQINIFESLSHQEKKDIVNKEYDIDIDDIKFINLIVVRSCAGSDQAWEINDKYKILNYSLISKVLCDKLKNKDFEFSNFEDEISTKQKELIATSNWRIEYETLKIDKYEIKFPNIFFDDNKIIPHNLPTFKCFPKLESAVFN